MGAIGKPKREIYIPTPSEEPEQPIVLPLPEPAEPVPATPVHRGSSR